MSSSSPIEARRIIGRHLVLDGAGAVVELPPGSIESALPRLRHGLRVLGWDVEPAWRFHQQGATLGIRAWPDVLEEAVDLLEWAAGDDDDVPLGRLARRASRWASPRARELYQRFPGLVFEGEDRFTVGLGVHARSWPQSEPPSVDEVGSPRGVPMATITGTNGKTTTTRLLAHILSQAGLTVGSCTSGGVIIGADTVERGDWTGPGAARRVLRDNRVQVAVLETARGGLLRRGLAVDGAEVAVVTNVTSEHLGRYGVDTVEDLARAKLVIAQGLRRGGILVLPAVSDPIYAALPALRAARPDIRLWTFGSRGPGRGLAGWADDQRLYIGDGSVALHEIPICFSGTARHNVENALCAALAAVALGLPGEVIGNGLRSFRPSVEDNPGRMNLFRLPSGALVVLDFAHTWDGLLRVAEAVRAWPRSRRTLLIGQVGDRHDDELFEFGRAVAALAPSRVVLKEVTSRQYESAPGRVPALLARGMAAAGVPRHIVEGPTPDESSGVRLALRGVGSDDLVVLLLHEGLTAALPVLRELQAESVG